MSGFEVWTTLPTEQQPLFCLSQIIFLSIFRSLSILFLYLCLFLFLSQTHSHKKWQCSCPTCTYNSLPTYLPIDTIEPFFLSFFLTLPFTTSLLFLSFLMSRRTHDLSLTTTLTKTNAHRRLYHTYVPILSFSFPRYISPTFTHIHSLSLSLSLSLPNISSLSLTHPYTWHPRSPIYTNRTQVSLETLEKRAQRSASGSARTVVGLHSGVYNECVCANKPHTFVQLWSVWSSQKTFLSFTPILIR